uniref:Uncharacterized protein n=1 Tax=Myotis myotis TaxID=51298 RepID=A0A7J7RSJ9_MYOMY|nr:hypothetical protein mMyoMyo1_010184 [Myotis myotis]
MQESPTRASAGGWEPAGRGQRSQGVREDLGRSGGQPAILRRARWRMGSRYTRAGKGHLHPWREEGRWQAPPKPLGHPGRWAHPIPRFWVRVRSVALPSARKSLQMDVPVRGKRQPLRLKCWQKTHRFSSLIKTSEEESGNNLAKAAPALGAAGCKAGWEVVADGSPGPAHCTQGSQAHPANRQGPLGRGVTGQGGHGAGGSPGRGVTGQEGHRAGGSMGRGVTGQGGQWAGGGGHRAGRSRGRGVTGQGFMGSLEHAQAIRVQLASASDRDCASDGSRKPAPSHQGLWRVLRAGDSHTQPPKENGNQQQPAPAPPAAESLTQGNSSIGNK